MNKNIIKHAIYGRSDILLKNNVVVDNRKNESFKVKSRIKISGLSGGDRIIIRDKW